MNLMNSDLLALAVAILGIVLMAHLLWHDHVRGRGQK